MLVSAAVSNVELSPGEKIHAVRIYCFDDLTGFKCLLKLVFSACGMSCKGASCADGLVVVIFFMIPVKDLLGSCANGWDKR